MTFSRGCLHLSFVRTRVFPKVDVGKFLHMGQLSVLKGPTQLEFLLPILWLFQADFRLSANFDVQSTTGNVHNRLGFQCFIIISVRMLQGLSDTSRHEVSAIAFWKCNQLVGLFTMVCEALM